MTMTDDELLDLLRQALAAAEAQAHEATARAGRITRALAALEWPQAPAKNRGRRYHSEVAKRAAAQKAECPDCGQVVSRMGIGTHRRTKHGYRANGRQPKRQPEKLPDVPSGLGPIGKLPAVDEDRARAAAATAAYNDQARHAGLADAVARADT